MAKLDLEWLSVFDEIYKTGSVSGAADRLGLAQPTASTALNKLRVHFGDKLFSRTSKGMEPTPRARDIYPEIREVMALLEGLHQAGTTLLVVTHDRELGARAQRHIAVRDGEIVADEA